MIPLARLVKTVEQVFALPVLIVMPLLGLSQSEPVPVWMGITAVPIAVRYAQVRVKHAMGQEGIAVCCVSTMQRTMGVERVCAILDIGLIRIRVIAVLVTSLAAAVPTPPPAVLAMPTPLRPEPSVSAMPIIFL